jgi:hypothetical protein
LFVLLAIDPHGCARFLWLASRRNVRAGPPLDVRCCSAHALSACESDSLLSSHFLNVFLIGRSRLVFASRQTCQCGLAGAVRRAGRQAGRAAGRGVLRASQAGALILLCWPHTLTVRIMSSSPVTSAATLPAGKVVEIYQQRTKHRFTAYAAGPTTLDWDARPEPFRHFRVRRHFPCLWPTPSPLHRRRPARLWRIWQAWGRSCISPSA